MAALNDNSPQRGGSVAADTARLRRSSPRSRVGGMRLHLRRGRRYVAVSFVCLLLSNLILIAASHSGLSSGVAVLLSAAVLIPVGFVLQARIAFAVEPSIDAFLRYAAALAFNAPISWLVLLVVHDFGCVDMVWAAPSATAVLFFWTYFASHWALGRRRLHSPEWIAS